MSIRVLLADDHDDFRKSLRNFLEACHDFIVVAEANSGVQALRMAHELQPDVAVLDVRMKELNGILTIKPLIACSPKTAVLMLSICSEGTYVARARRAGAKGYLHKSSAENTVAEAIRTVHEGGLYFTTDRQSAL
jgi:DNA-binding NarL/FixJ family response regulator